MSLAEETTPGQALIDSIAISATAAGAFITDTMGRVLLVKSHSREYWGFVGGWVDRGESPHVGCVREIKEEIGLDLSAGDLLVLDWMPGGDLAIGAVTYYLFDGGVVDGPDRIRLQEDEIEQYGFFSPARASSLMAEAHVAFVDLALEARRTGKTAYLPLQQPR